MVHRGGGRSTFGLRPAGVWMRSVPCCRVETMTSRNARETGSKWIPPGAGVESW